jgi:hypothetical protein
VCEVVWTDEVVLKRVLPCTLSVSDLSFPGTAERRLVPCPDSLSLPPFQNPRFPGNLQMSDRQLDEAGESDVNNL